jgi:hypothetical protein
MAVQEGLRAVLRSGQSSNDSVPFVVGLSEEEDEEGGRRVER